MKKFILLIIIFLTFGSIELIAQDLSQFKQKHEFRNRQKNNENRIVNSRKRNHVDFCQRKNLRNIQRQLTQESLKQKAKLHSSYKNTSSREKSNRQKSKTDIRHFVLDSVYSDWLNETNNIWYKDKREHYIYNDWGEKIEYYSYFWDIKLNAKTGEQLVIYAYNKYGDLIEETIHQWDIEANAWQATKKYIDDYDAEGYSNEKSYYEWDQNINDWIGVYRYLPVFESDGVTYIGEIEYTWDNVTNNWLSSFFHTLRNNKYGQIVQSTDYTMNGNINDRVENYRYTYSYDDEGVLTEKHGYTWNSDIENWTDDIKTLYGMNEDYFEDVKYLWNNNLAIWEKDYIIKYKLDQLNQVIVDEYYYWNINIKDWAGEKMHNFAYDGDVITEEITYIWSFDRKDWIPNYKYVYTLDKNDNFGEDIGYYWKSDENIWFKNYYVVYYWSELKSTGLTDQITNNEIVIYPNPVVDNLTITSHFIEKYNVDIYSISGRKVFSQNDITNNNILDIQHLNTGKYILKIWNSKTDIIKMFVKE